MCLDILETHAITRITRKNATITRKNTIVTSQRSINTEKNTRAISPIMATRAGVTTVMKTNGWTSEADFNLESAAKLPLKTAERTASARPAIMLWCGAIDGACSARGGAA